MKAKVVLSLSIAALILAGSVSYAACCGTKVKAVSDTVSVQTETVKAAEQLCAKCGQVKGSETCCKADAQKCGKCNLQKGSAGCIAACKSGACPLSKKAGCSVKAKKAGCSLTKKSCSWTKPAAPVEKVTTGE